MLEPFLERRVERGIEELLYVPEGAKAGPDFAHGFDIERGERADGCGVEVDGAAIVAEEDRAGDDAGAVLEEDDRARIGAQAGGRITKYAVAAGEIAQEEVGLHVFDAAAVEAGRLIAHRPDSNCRDLTSHVGLADSKDS